MRSAIALEAGDGGLAAAIADAFKLELAPADDERRVARQAVDAFGEQLEPHLALDAMSPGDRGERDLALFRGPPATS